MEKRDINKAYIDGIENLKPGEGVNVGDTKYEYGADLVTEGTPIIDSGTGKTILIRDFIFKIDPSKLREIKDINKQTLFNSNAKQISTILWGDGLVPYEKAQPRVIINLKKGFYQIFVPCEAKRGVLFMEKPKNLSEELAKGKLEKPKTR